MSPNTQESDLNTISFAGSFWSKDKSGMTQLLDYMKSTHADLDIIFTIYTQRSQFEQEFGEKLLVLSSIHEIDQNEAGKGGVSAAYHAISMELNKTATSHLDLAEQLKTQIGSEFEQKLNEYKELLEKWTKTLTDLYNDRQDKTIELLKIRAKYLKEHEISKGQSTSTMDKLKSHYKALVTDVDELSQEWNTIWRDACEVMQAMEEDRIEFLKSNVWEYANLASARLLIEDEWCETIRDQLEKCSTEQEIEKCVSIYGTGSKIPSTNDYVGEQMKEQKRKNAERASKTPTPPVKPARQPEKSHPLPHPEIPKPSIEQETPKPKPRFQQDPPQPKPRTKQESQLPKPGYQKEIPQPKPRTDVPSTKNRQIMNQWDKTDKNGLDLQQKQRPHHKQTKADDEGGFEQDELPTEQSRSQTEVNSFRSTGKTNTQKQQSQSNYSFKQDEERINSIRNKVSDNIGSTAARAQIKRKPLNKSLMDQVSNQMAVAKQQREIEQNESRCSSPQSSVKSGSTHQSTSTDGSLESLLKTFEIVNPINQPPPNATVSDEARFRRQPSEYKPDTGSIPSRRGINENTRVLQEIHDSNPSSINSNTTMQHPFTYPVAPPKSPRPPPQHIDGQPQEDERNQNYQQNTQISTQVPVQHQPQQYPASPNMMMQQIPDQESIYSHNQQQKHPYGGQSQFMGQQHMGQTQQHMGQTQQHIGQTQQHIGQTQQYMGQTQQHINQPQRSPMMQPQRSPIMQPQRSPMMQPQRSPMMQPQRSPMMQPQRSPMMQPQRSPMMQPQRSPMMAPVTYLQQNYGTQSGGLPPPITIPTNYGVTPQPSPAMTYTTGNGGVSPGGVLPPPAVPYHQPPQAARPGQYSDGRPVLFWARAKYDYTASDEGELSFAANTLIGILEADMTQQSWWIGAIINEYRQTWSIPGSIPSNFMANA
ncbi:hypothetical protein INT47_009396 [Mucor saturninus]|uniref:SH3 domain-containing protein n=1 Tax=Mucor saturninus TaxID=64648 RepID=A0A8H7V7S2_9FUNG|nr:hypothetical protein INT47_009396 [Mucor saturninus]